MSERAGLQVESVIGNAANLSWIQRVKEHGELIAAAAAGILIAAGWIVGAQSMHEASTSLFIAAFLIGGFAKAREGILESIREKTLNVELLMIFAAIGSGLIGYWTEGAILIFIFAVSGALETYTINKSERELSSLITLQPQTALLINESGQREIVSAESLEKGDYIEIKAGERIPADGLVYSGNALIDQSAITGESMPVEKKTKEEVFAGTVNINSSIIVIVTKASNETLFSKMINLVQSAKDEKSPSQQFIERFEGAYVKGVLAAVSLMMILPHFLLGWTWTETFYRAMVLMVVASPCALVASVMPATLAAISNGARNGLLFKGGIHLERLSRTGAVAFDKTGTLTKGRPAVTDVILRHGVNEAEFLRTAAAIESQSNHPLAKAIVQYALDKGVEKKFRWLSVQEQSGKGVKAEWQRESWRIGSSGYIGSKACSAFQQSVAEELGREGKTLVFAEDSKGIAGLFAFKDTVREDTADTIETLKKIGVYTVMLTGDNQQTAEAVASEARMDEVIANCLPEDKVEAVKKLRKKHGYVAMIGDGINDAPALAAADIGVAMGEGTDVALETADVVLMKNELANISRAIELSRKMTRIIKQNIIFSLSVIGLLISSNFLQILDLPLGVIGHEGSTILVILNGLRLLKG
ncbi:heavy metal translocating P-type ATPase [Bacillus lacus]|uniref:Heavy metal translocating P-type ATPase n=1 Tax=Metabacillus lacus TaxID=1983721 RepID=A0A7X2LZS6_9BACI|nr:heavy metal translocating P-type ATPase [Metabacillus lacus]MRX72277.1 heavy metal translocating P-type ATPase [Metabacillus lacus]